MSDIEVHPNPCLAGWGMGRCDDNYTRVHSCVRDGDHPSPHRCGCGAKAAGTGLSARGTEGGTDG